MAQPSQFTLMSKEILELAVKHLNLHEGLWTFGVSFGFAPGNFGADPNSMNPGIAIAANSFTVTRIDPSVMLADPLMRPPPSLVVDAALINPLPKPTADAEPPKQPPPRRIIRRLS
jgi:hypothetical protein